MNEIPLMEIIQIIQKKLHIACFLGQNEPVLMLCNAIATSELLKSAVRNWIVANITQCERHEELRYARICRRYPLQTNRGRKEAVVYFRLRFPLSYRCRMDSAVYRAISCPRSARRRPAVHPAPAVPHGWRPASVPVRVFAPQCA